MSIQSAIRTAFAAVQTAAGDAVVSVVSGSVTVNGFKSTRTEQSVLADIGEDGPQTGTVRVDASAMSKPERGASITVAGDQVTVTNADIDSVGALWVISWVKQRPVT